MDDQYKILLDIHGMVKKLEGQFESLNCAKHEKEMYCIKIDHQNLVDKVNNSPKNTWVFISGLIFMLIGIVGLFLKG